MLPVSSKTHNNLRLPLLCPLRCLSNQAHHKLQRPQYHRKMDLPDLLLSTKGHMNLQLCEILLYQYCLINLIRRLLRCNPGLDPNTISLPTNRICVREEMEIWASIPQDHPTSVAR